MKKRILAVRVALMAVGGLVSCLYGQENGWPSVWDGVYTASQASRGEAAYRANCASCHGAKLEGQGRVPALTGRDFQFDWDFMGVDNLFEKILFTMPLNRQGQLSAAREAEILAYILKFNRFPAGNRELPADAEQLRVVVFEADRAAR
jgi:mono/diheme cytochrome c family protein